MMSGDKTASVMTSWTTKVLNSRRRRRQFLLQEEDHLVNYVTTSLPEIGV